MIKSFKSPSFNAELAMVTVQRDHMAPATPSMHDIKEQEFIALLVIDSKNPLLVVVVSQPITEASSNVPQTDKMSRNSLG